MNFQSICRVCTSERTGMTSIFECYNFSGHYLEIFAVIIHCASVQIQKSDEFPEQICKNCLNHLCQAYSFKQLCENSDYKFRNNLIVEDKIVIKSEEIHCANNESDIEFTEIKTEFVEEDTKIQYNQIIEECDIPSNSQEAESKNLIDEIQAPQHNLIESAMLQQQTTKIRDYKQRKLKRIPEKQKRSASEKAKSWDDDTPLGLQRKFFHIVGNQLAWRSTEAVNCLTYFFKKSKDGRIEYNPRFSKTGGDIEMENSKWLISNLRDPDICPVRLYTKLMEKRTEHIKTDRLFLTVNPAWNKPIAKGWYKNSPVGRNELSKWIKML